MKRLHFYSLLFTLLSGFGLQAQVTMSPWQVHNGQGVIPLDSPLSESGADEAFAKVNIPGQKDAGWTAAPVDGQGRITFQGSPSLDSSATCLTTVDYTYFQSEVFVPADMTMDRFAMTFESITDGAELFVFNSNYPKGQIKERGKILKGEKTFSANVAGLIKKGEVNRLVLVHVDDCPDTQDKIAGGTVKMDKKFYSPVSHPGSPAKPEPAFEKVYVNSEGVQPFDIDQPSMPLNYIIALYGKYPSGPIGDGFIGEIRLFAGNYAPSGWAFCHGQLISISQNTALFSLIGTIYGGDGRTTFALPDLRGRVPIGVGKVADYDFRKGQRGGVETHTLTAGELPPHSHKRGHSAGTDYPFNNMQPYLAMNYIIAVTGNLPTKKGETGIGNPEGTIGEIKLYAGYRIPEGYMACNGQELSVQDYANLFKIIGNTYGGDGRSTFALPDLRGKAAVHMGSGSGRSTYKLGQNAGTYEHTMTEEELPDHTHWSDVNALGTTTSVDVRLPVLALNYVILTNGVFPSRDGSMTNESGSMAEVRIFAGDWAPAGTASCDGQQLQINANAASFSLLGTFYGGDGRSTFKLPDLRGRVVTGVGSGSGLTPRVLGKAYGVEKAVLSVKNIPEHRHD